MDYAELRELQVLPLEYKVIITKQRIQEWYEHWDGKVYVSFSGGKDSTVLLHIVRELYPEVPAVFVDTGLEYPEIRKFVKSVDNVIWLRSKLTFKQVLERYGYPVISKEQAIGIRKLRNQNISYKYKRKLLYGDENGTSGKIAERWKYLINAPFDISEQCCDAMKKRPAHQFYKDSGLAVFTGEQAVNSRRRLEQWLRHGCNGFDLKFPKSTPLGFWTDQDVLQYLLDNNLPYASVYGDIIKQGDNLITTGVDRTGCMFCMFGVHLESELNRFQRMQVTHPKQYNYCINGGQFKDGKWGPSKEGLGLGFVLDYIGVSYNDRGNLWSTKELIEMQ